MVDRPIMFSAPMVRALVENRKTQTRRLASSPLAKCQPGDLLWVREHCVTYTSARSGNDYAFFPSTDPTANTRVPEGNGTWARKVRPAIHMPRWASRLTLEISSVRIQRLQDITEEDAIAEGATMRPACHGFRSCDDGWSMDWARVGQRNRFGTDGVLTERDISLGSARSAFGAFINELHGGRNWNLRPEPPLWDRNPEIAALTFTVRIENIDRL